MKTILPNRNGQYWLFLTIYALLIGFAPITAQAQHVQEEWARQYGGVVPSQQSSVVLAVDDEDNSYVAGISSGTAFDDFVVVAKYDAAGGEVWRNSFNTGRGDAVRAITVDDAGGVYLVGSSTDNSLRSSLILLKYSAADGQLLWSASQNPGRSSVGLDVATDNLGGIYVTGSTDNLFSGFTNFLSKYKASDGSLLWSRNLAEPGNPADSHTISDIALDIAGDVFLTGTKTCSWIGRACWASTGQ